MRWFGWVVVLAGFAAGCSSNIKNDTGAVEVADEDADADVDPGLLDFQVAEASTVAGFGVAFSAAWVRDEESVPVEAFTIVSDVEAPLSVSAEALVATRAGSHLLTMTAVDAAGVEQSAEAALVVQPAALADLGLVVSPEAVAAGEPAACTVTGEDAYGNAVDVSAAVITASEGVSVGADNTLIAEAVGVYTATATADELAATADWTVVPAEPAAIVLDVEETEGIEAGDDVDYSVSVTDAYGNACDAATTVECDDSTVVVEADEFEFTEDGVFTCLASVVDSDLADSVTFVIDGVGPQLTVATPDRGSWTTATAVTVSGTAVDEVTDVAAVTVNGAAVPHEGGAFSHELVLTDGLTVIETLAFDTDADESGTGNRSSDIRTVLRAPAFQGPDAPLSDGIIVRMQDDAGGLGRLEALGSSLITSDDIASTVVGEVFADSFCALSLPWAGCVSTISAVAYVDSISVGSIDMDIDPRSSGLLVARVTLSAVAAAWHMDVSGGPDLAGTLGADAIVVEVALRPYVSALGTFVVPVDSVTVSRSGFYVEVDGPIDTIVGWFGFDVEDEVWGPLSSAVEGEVAALAPDLIDDTLSALELEVPIDLLDNTYTLSATIAAVDVDDDGLDVRFGTRLTPDEVLGTGVMVGPSGAPLYGYGAPDWAAASGTTLALSGDFINQLLYAFWQGGLLDQEVTDEDLGFDLSTIALLLPGLSELTMVTTPLLPPIATPRTSPDDDMEFDLFLGDMLVELHNGAVGDDSLYMELYVTVSAPLDLDAADDGASIEIAVGDPTVHIDISYTDPEFTITREATEGLFGDLMPLYLPELTGALGAIPLPEFASFGLTDIATGMAGTDVPPGYWSLSGSLAD